MPYAPQLKMLMGLNLNFVCRPFQALQNPMERKAFAKQKRGALWDPSLQILQLRRRRMGFYTNLYAPFWCVLVANCLAQADETLVRANAPALGRVC